MPVSTGPLPMPALDSEHTNPISLCGALNDSYWMRLGIYKSARHNENQAGTAETPRIGNVKYCCNRVGCQVKPMKALNRRYLVAM